jgi:hypothetical protein
MHHKLLGNIYNYAINPHWCTVKKVTDFPDPSWDVTNYFYSVDTLATLSPDMLSRGLFIASNLKFNLETLTGLLKELSHEIGSGHA